MKNREESEVITEFYSARHYSTIPTLKCNWIFLFIVYVFINVLMFHPYVYEWINGWMDG